MRQPDFYGHSLDDILNPKRFGIIRMCSPKCPICQLNLLTRPVRPRIPRPVRPRIPRPVRPRIPLEWTVPNRLYGATINAEGDAI